VSRSASGINVDSNQEKARRSMRDPTICVDQREGEHPELLKKGKTGVAG
jgi:hypothetical protein